MLTPVRLNTNQTDTGLDQKVRGQSSGVPNSPDADFARPAERRALTHSGTHSERGKPVALPASSTRKSSLGKRAARRAHTAGMGGWKKLTPSCNEMDRGDRCLTRKRAHFHLVSTHERS